MAQNQEAQDLMDQKLEYEENKKLLNKQRSDLVSKIDEQKKII